MELVSGFPLLIQQFTALFKKNLLLAWRNKWGTCVQLFSSFFFIFLIFCIQKALEARSASSTDYKSIEDPAPLVSPPIPPCEEKFFVKQPCYDFVWSGDGSSKIRNIVTAIMANNPGRPIPATKVKSFSTSADVDEWLSNNPMTCSGALHFSEREATVISYGIQTNSTAVAKRKQFEERTFKFQIPLQIAAEREIVRSLIGVPNFSWDVSFKEFAHPARELYSAIKQVGPTFFLATAMFGFVFQMSSLIVEKELKLREVGFAFMLSAFVSKASSSTTVGFTIFILGFLSQLVTTAGFPYASGFSKTSRFLWSLFPPNLLAKALKILADATSTPQDRGISLSGITECGPNDFDCVITLSDIYKWLMATFIIWFVLAIYLDNIVPNASGVKKPVYYFLTPGYWIGIGGNKVKEGDNYSSAPPLDGSIPDDVDVLEEENIVKQQARDGAVLPNIAVQIRGLVRTYPGTRKGGCCCCGKKTAPYHAVKGLWVNFAKDQLFCLLGPNGAGKTTTISCLTGLAPVTGGDALIYGHSARSSVGMANIRKIIGVCPQFDILWSALTGQEHLQLFATIKGLPQSSIESVAKKSLAEVKLDEAARMRAGSYSGGMKRRLSVAIALIGDPKLVILDEPTTGMDPITRRHVWDIIEDAKKGRAIVLTTHSMEEADILSDRIGIMAKGKLRCIGTSIRLKSRFGSGFIANVSFSGSTNSVNTPHHKAVKLFFEHHLGVLPKEENSAFLTFVIPHDKEGLLTRFFAELQDRQHEFNIADIQLGLTTLEEVFLNIARQAELEAAITEGRLVTLTLTSGASFDIPVGTKYTVIPGTESPQYPRGFMVEVYWDQDESGKLCISGHAPETPVPPTGGPTNLHFPDPNHKKAS